MASNRLKASRFAPRTPAETPALSRAERTKQDREKVSRLLARLRWRAESLGASYVRAMDIVQMPVDQDGHLDRRKEVRYPFVLVMDSVSRLPPPQRMLESNFRKKQAESMFKVDFFEFYALLERYITLCLSMFGVSISADGPRSNVNALRFITNTDFAKSRAESSHQFHANLLEALDEPSNPLHATLGHQDVRIQLGLAKDYRNRWKDADTKLTHSQWASEDEERHQIRLADLDLGNMLHTILVGCERALNVVHDQPETSSGANRTAPASAPSGYHGFDSMDMDDAPLEYMEDAMELD